jgi:hypothetical protein
MNKLTKDKHLALILSILIATFGAIWIIYGLAIISLDHIDLPSLANLSPVLLGWCWIATGGATFVLMLTPRVPRWLAYPPAVFMPMMWTVAFAFAWADWRVPYSWQGAAIWAGLTLTVVLAAIAERLTNVRT